jgi:hypothetical protein
MLVFDGTVSCSNAGTIDRGAGRSETITVDGRTYCKTQKRGAAAGTVYDQLAYEFQRGDKIYVAVFTIRMPQCLNYEESLHAVCQAEQANFKVDEVADKIIDTLQVQ